MCTRTHKRVLFCTRTSICAAKRNGAETRNTSSERHDARGLWFLNNNHVVRLRKIRLLVTPPSRPRGCVCKIKVTPYKQFLTSHMKTPRGPLRRWAPPEWIRRGRFHSGTYRRNAHVTWTLKFSKEIKSARRKKKYETEMNYPNSLSSLPSQTSTHIFTSIVAQAYWATVFFLNILFQFPFMFL